MSMKRILAIVLAMMMVLGLAGCGGDSDSPPAGIPENPASDFEYRTITGGIEITGYKGSATEVRIPSIIEGAHVVSISGAFQNRSAITAVIIPDSVTNIGSNSFEGCKSLTSIALPDGLISLGEGVFRGSGIANITLPDSVTSVARGAFGCCFRADGRGDADTDDWDVRPTEEEIDEMWRNRPDCCDNRNLVSVTYKSVTYYAERATRSVSWDLPQEFYDNFR
jgi:hypothetical protein